MPSRRNARRILVIATLVIVAAILAGRVVVELLGR